jgi:hypothetical protein
MSLDSELQGIVRENENDLLAFARKLYEHGYRQGLASRPPGSELTQVPEVAQVATPSLSPVRAPLFPAPAPTAVVSEAEEADAIEDEEPEAQSCDHRVRGSITVAGLQKKIERLFDLSRFDIEVVICRRQDPERRRLKSTVRLKNYLLEGE